jgi:TM2 domain-containing membrane protein YozV
MPLISTDCPGCGAPIKLRDGQGTCTFCGKQIMLEPKVQPALPVQPAPSFFPRVEEFSPHSPIITTLLALTLGYMGVHRFYTGSIGLGVVYLLTGGLFLLGWMADIIQLLTGSFFDGNNRKLRPLATVWRVVGAVWGAAIVILILLTLTGNQ